jgi:dihydropteroate synthase
MEKNKTAVEWLAEKYNYLAWMRTRDEISAGLAVEWLENFLEEAKKMEKQQIIDADLNATIRTAKGANADVSVRRVKELAEEYYNKTYGKQQNG